MAAKPTYAELEKRVQELEDAHSKLKLSMATLQERQKQQEFLTEQTLLPIVIVQEDKIVYANKAYSELTGYPLRQILKWRIEDTLKLIHPDYRKFVISQARKKMRGESSGIVNHYQYKAINRKSEEKWVDQYSKTVLYNGKTADMISMIDITKSKQAIHLLRESEEKYRLLAENVDDVIWRSDLAFNWIYISPSFIKLTGYSSEEAVKMPLPEMITADSAEIAANVLMEELGKLKGPQANDIVKKLEVEFFCKDGSTVWAEINTKIQMDSDGKPVALLGVTRDISDRKRAEALLLQSEEKLIRSKKMESMGLLAGGVAHDLNNILSGIVSYPELILMDLPEGSKLRAPIETMRESGHRAVAIVQDLLTVARGVATTKEPLNLNELVNDYFHSPEFRKLKQFSPAVMTRTNLATDLLNIEGSDVHIRKILMNLVSNAAEAIQNNGIVSVATANRFVDRPLKGYDDVKRGEYVVLAVSDNGSGIAPDDLERIFEPFYTKKVMGRSGTGLGLAVVWNTVQDHKGYIDVTSDENGTTFELYFPITRAEISGKDLPLRIIDYKGNGETVLVIDDMENQREISCKMLAALGYKTRSVSSGEEAVEYLQTHTVDMLLLDMIMDPGMNGRQTYERIIEIHPNQKAIITSGYAETEDVKAVQKLGSGRYIKKPLTLEKIGLAVKEELEA